MIRILQLKFLILFFLFSSQIILAQGVVYPENPKKENAVPASNSGFKTQSYLSVRTEKESPSPLRADTVSINNEVNSNKISVNLDNNIDNEAVSFDYTQIPIDVQKKIDFNKATGKKLLDGIAKAFTVEIKSCTSTVSAKTELIFLEKDSRFISTEFVSPGIVRLNVINSFDSVELKELMLGARIGFNFLNEFYFVKE